MKPFLTLITSLSLVSLLAACAPQADSTTAASKNFAKSPFQLYNLNCGNLGNGSLKVYENKEIPSELTFAGNTHQVRYVYDEKHTIGYYITTDGTIRLFEVTRDIYTYTTYKDANSRVPLNRQNCNAYQAKF